MSWESSSGHRNAKGVVPVHFQVISVKKKSGNEKKKIKYDYTSPLLPPTGSQLSTKVIDLYNENGWPKRLYITLFYRFIV